MNFKMVKPIAEYRRKEILEAALSAINRHGLSKVSYDLIAEEASTSRQLIRHYYPKLEPLMVDIVETITESYRQLVINDINSIKSAQRLSIMMDFFFGQLQDRQLPPSMSFDSMFALANNSEPIRQAMHTTHQILSETFQNELRVCYPTLPLKVYQELGHQFVSLITGHWRMVSSLGMSDKYTSVSRKAMDRLIQSYLDEHKVQVNNG